MEEKVRDRSFRYHDALRRTGALLGHDEDCSREWVSETRSNYHQYACSGFPRQRPPLLVTSLDQGRHNNPQPLLASLIKARHGQKNVCSMETRLPPVPRVLATEKSAYNIEFPHRGRPVRHRVKSAPVPCAGILPSCRVPVFDDVRQEILYPVDISVKCPSTTNPNKYVCRRKKVGDDRNQHRTHDLPYGVSGVQPVPRVPSSLQRYFVTTQGTPLRHRRHLSAPPSSLTVKGFDGGAPRITDNTMHAQLIPFLRGPRII